jgi:hypothetical protein
VDSHEGRSTTVITSDLHRSDINSAVDDGGSISSGGGGSSGSSVGGAPPANDASATNAKIEWLRAQLPQMAAQTSSLYTKVEQLEATLAREREAHTKTTAENLADLQQLQRMHAQQVAQLQLQLQASQKGARRAERALTAERDRSAAEIDALKRGATVVETATASARASVDAERLNVRCVRGDVWWRYPACLQRVKPQSPRSIAPDASKALREPTVLPS